MNSTYVLRYYLPERKYFSAAVDPFRERQRQTVEQVVALLERIKESHGIRYELFELPYRESGAGHLSLDSSHAEEIYRTHFVTRAHVLRRRVGTSVPRALRSRQGRGSIYLNNTVAVLENGQVGWFTCFESGHSQFRCPEEEGGYVVGFLRAVAERGADLLREICPTIASPQERLIASFLASDCLVGKFVREVRVGSSIFRSQRSTFDWRKAIDLVCHADDGSVWVIEVKPKLNWEAFGQVIAYGYLYEREHGVSVKRAVLCSRGDPEIESICRDPRFDISVLQGFA